MGKINPAYIMAMRSRKSMYDEPYMRDRSRMEDRRYMGDMGHRSKGYYPDYDSRMKSYDMYGYDPYKDEPTYVDVYGRANIHKSHDMYGEHEKKKKHMDMEMARMWVSSMINTDPEKSHGEKWDFEQAKPYLLQAGIKEEHLPGAWAVMCSLYSDYYMVFKNHGVNQTPEFYADLTKAWLWDEDAKDNKVMNYYCYVVEH